jgi:hypothetical protein
MNPRALVLALLVLVLGSGCTTFCVVGVRESAAVVCTPGESFESCLPKVEADLQAKQEAVIELVKNSAKK